MFESLIKYNKNICLNYLCLDDESFYKIKEINKPNLIPYHIDDLIKNNEDFKKLREKTKPEAPAIKNSLGVVYGNHMYFFWGLASFFSYYLLEKKKENIVYIDSDIKFYDDIKIIFDKMENKSVCLFRHKHVVRENYDGMFNIGVIVFKNNEKGLNALKWWRDAFYNQQPKHLDTCGDQKFIEGIFDIIGQENIYIGDKDIGHGAPWNYRFFNYDFLLDENKIVWGDKKQIFLFNHFSKFKPDFDNLKFDYVDGNYMDHTFNNNIFSIPQLKFLHENYFNDLLTIKKKYGV
jgi:hypothetical protein